MQAPDGPGQPAGESPRCHHYVLAHYALRQIALGQPLYYLGVLGSPDAQEFLASVFARVDEHCRGSGATADFSAADLRVHRGRVGQYPCAVIELPAPQAAAEAYFTALVGQIDLGELPDQRPEHVAARYFTLELGRTLAGESYTVFCEWDASTHHNHGDGPPPDPAAFIDRIVAAMGLGQGISAT